MKSRETSLCRRPPPRAASVQDTLSSPCWKSRTAGIDEAAGPPGPGLPGTPPTNKPPPRPPVGGRVRQVEPSSGRRKPIRPAQTSSPLPASPTRRQPARLPLVSVGSLARPASTKTPDDVRPPRHAGGQQASPSSPVRNLARPAETSHGRPATQQGFPLPCPRRPRAAGGNILPRPCGSARSAVTVLRPPPGSPAASHGRQKLARRGL